MSKHDKDSLISSLSDEAHSAEFSADSTQPALQSVSGETAKTERSRVFNLWLDRTLPMLQQMLGGHTTGAVTSPGTKPKH